MAHSTPIPLRGATAWRTYLGGRLIRQLHGEPNAIDDHFPEEWLTSVVTARNPGRESIVEGLSVAYDNESLRNKIAANPAEMLGAAFAAQFGGSCHAVWVATGRPAYDNWSFATRGPARPASGARIT